MRFDDIPSAWRGHEDFAGALVRLMQPDIIVELGVDYGFSTIALARPNIGTVYAFDHFQGDLQTGARNTKAIFEENLRDAEVKNVEWRHIDFNSAFLEWKLGAIDLLHIDGAHDYQSVYDDFNQWSALVRDGGVILLHDTRSFPNDVGKLFGEIEWQKFEFQHSGGLGCVLKDKSVPWRRYVNGTGRLNG